MPGEDRFQCWDFQNYEFDTPRVHGMDRGDCWHRQQTRGTTPGLHPSSLNCQKQYYTSLLMVFTINETFKLTKIILWNILCRNICSSFSSSSGWEAAHVSNRNGEQLTAIPGNGWVCGAWLMLILWIPSSWSFILRKCPDSLSLFSKPWNRISLWESLSCQYTEVFMWLLGRHCQLFPDLGKSLSPPVLLAPTKILSEYLITKKKKNTWAI